MFEVTIALLIVVICLIWGYFRWRHNYFKTRGISGPSPMPIIGHMHKIFFGERWHYLEEVYKSYKEKKIFGMYEFGNPNLFLCDPNLIRNVFVKDFDSFTNRRDFSFSKDEYLGEMLSTINGDKWKRLRSTMSPTFSSGKMKNMYSIVQEQAKNFVKHCEREMKSNSMIDVKKSFGLYTMDVIAKSAFGIECGSLIKENPIFATVADKMFENTPMKMVKMTMLLAMPRIANILGITFTDKSWDFFKDVSNETVAQRRNEKDEKTKRGDFLDLLLDEQEKQKGNFDETKDYRITETTILAESVLFLIAGYDTTANALSITSHFLAKYPEFQNKLRNELQELKDTEKFDYHGIMEAKYLDACISEALRLVPPLPALERTCVKDYLIPEHNFTVPKGMLVSVPIYGLHRDPEYWQDPNEFNPDRFLPENKSNITPNTYMPFGLGPRNCIAMRFALMESKICLAEMILNYKIQFAPGYGELKLENGGSLIRPSVNSVVLLMEKM